MTCFDDAIRRPPQVYVSWVFGLMDATLESEVLLSHRAIEAFDFTAREMANSDLLFDTTRPSAAANLA
jgi:hypothetical protein